MTESTLSRLLKNPHYKLSKQQKEEAAFLGKAPMIEIGKPRIHDTSFKTHSTKVEKRESDVVELGEEAVHGAPDTDTRSTPNKKRPS